MERLSTLVILLPSLVSALTLNEAIIQTVESSPQLNVKKADLSAENELLDRAQSGYLPSIDLSYSAGYEETRTLANSRENVDVIRQEGSITLTQNVFAGLDTINAVEQQEALISSASSSVTDSANSIALETATAYVELLRTKELLDVAQQNVNVHKKYLDQIQELVDAGVGRSSDQKQTLSRYENAQSVLYLSQQNYDNAVSTFQRILPVEITKDNIERPSVLGLPAESLEEVVAMALEQNPQIHTSLANIEYAEATLNRSYATYYPQADIVAQGYWNDRLNGLHQLDEQVGASVPQLGLTENSGANVLLVLSYNIFNGLADSSSKEANRYKVLSQKSNLEDTKRFIKAYTTIAWQTFKSTELQLVHIDRNIAASADTVSAYQEEHDLGRRSIIDLLNIELEHNAAKNRKVATEYDRLLAYYQLLTHTGTMLEAMNVTVK